MFFIFNRKDEVIATQKTKHKDGTLSILHKETGVVLRGEKEKISEFIEAFENYKKNK